jgi:hypothetical protein
LLTTVALVLGLTERITTAQSRQGQTQPPLQGGVSTEVPATPESKNPLGLYQSALDITEKGLQEPALTESKA